MKNDLEIILKKYSSSNLEYNQSDSANTIFFQLYHDNFHDESILIKIINDLIPFNFFADAWLLYRLSKDLRIETLEHLSNKGFDVAATDDNGENILFKIFEQTQYSFSSPNFEKFSDSFNRLIKLGINCEVVNIHGRNLIHQTIEYTFNDIFLNHIVSLKIDINKQDNNGFTPLHFVAQRCVANTLNLINILLLNGASISKHLKTNAYNYDTPESSLSNGLTPLEVFESEKETYIDFTMYEKEIIEKLTT